MTENQMPVAAQDQPDAYGFGFAEIAYLLKAVGDDGAKSAEVLRLESETADERLCVAGASSLLARGLLTVDGEDLNFAGPAAAIAYALAKAHRWTEISLMAEDSIDTVLHVESGTVSILMQPRMLQTWFIFAQDPAIDGAAAQLEMLKKHVAEHSGGSAYLKVRTRDGDADLLLRSDGDRWAVGRIVDRSSGDVDEETGLTDDALLLAIQGVRGESPSRV